MSAAAEVAQLRQHLEEVIDECSYTERQRAAAQAAADAAVAKERTMVEIAECLVGYVAEVEHSVLSVAFGSVTNALQQFHEAARLRARGEALLVAGVNPATHPRLSRLFASMQAPTPETARLAARSQLLDAPVGTLQQVEDGYVALSALTRERDQLVTLLRAANAAARRTATSASPERLASSGSERLAGENASLRAEVNLLQQKIDAQSRLVDNDSQLLSVRLEQALRSQRSAEAERDALRSKASFEQLYQQATTERRLLQERVAQLEEQVAQHNAERMQVAVRFETLQRALLQHQPQLAASLGSFSPPFDQGSSMSGAADSVRRADRQESLLRDAAARERKLEKEILDLRRRLAGAPPAMAAGMAYGDVSSSSAMTAGIGGGGHEDSVASGESASAQRHRLRAFELTVEALNGELAVLEEKILTIERRHAEEKQALEAAVEAERVRSAHEQRECDDVLNQLTSELDQAMAENGQLRQRVKALMSR